MFFLRVVPFALVLIGTSDVVRAQWTMSEIINRVSQEKAKVVSFRVVMSQEPQTGKRFERCTWIHEQSDIGDHRVVAMLRKNESGAISSWGIWGRSDDVIIYGSSDDQVIAARRFHAEQDRGRGLKCLDWRILGIGFCGDVGSPYEEIAKNVSAWDKPTPPKVDVSKKERISVDVEASSPPVFIELEHIEGLRFTKFRLGYDPDLYPKVDKRDYSEWNVRYEKISGLSMPVEASLICGEKEVVHYELDWKMVNDPVELGIPTGKRFAELIKGSKFVDKTDD